MQIHVDAKTFGLEGVMTRVERLGRVTTSPYVREGLRQGAEHLRLSGRGRLTTLLKGYQTGRLVRSMSAEMGKRGRMASYAGFRRGRDGGNHAHLVDQGTVARYTRRGAYRGVMPANRFWTTTRMSERANVEEKVLRGLRLALSTI